MTARVIFAAIAAAGIVAGTAVLARASETPAPTAPAAQAVAQPAAAAVIESAIDKEGLAAGVRQMDEIDAHADLYSVSEKEINALGYKYLARGAFDEAVAVFGFNVRRFPASDNVYDSLAEAAAKAGDKARLEAALEAWLAKSPGDAGVSTRAERFRRLAARCIDERRHPYKAGQPTGVRGAYVGQTPPGATPELFAPGIISMTSTGDYAPTFTPDGKELYFTRAWADTTRTQRIMVSRLVDGGWTFPEPFEPASGFNAHEPHVTLDGAHLYWGWFRPVPAGEPNRQKMDYGIWACDRTSDGRWSAPRFVGQGMFVSSSRDGQVYVTDHTELPKGYLARVRVVDGKFAGFDRLGGGIEKLRSDKIQNIAHPAIAPDGSYIVFDIDGGSHLFVSFRNADGTWGDAIDLAGHGIDRMSGIASVSPDGKYLFFNSGGDLYWVSTRLIDALRPRAGDQRAP